MRLNIKRKTCHGRGLEDVDECEVKGIHRSCCPRKLPCCVCIRNPETSRDFYSEKWCLDENNEPLIEDPNEAERAMIEALANMAAKEVTNS